MSTCYALASSLGSDSGADNPIDYNFCPTFVGAHFGVHAMLLSSLDKANWVKITQKPVKFQYP
jgi:hypothetical protein